MSLWRLVPAETPFKGQSTIYGKLFYPSMTSPKPLNVNILWRQYFGIFSSYFLLLYCSCLSIIYKYYYYLDCYRIINKDRVFYISELCFMEIAPYLLRVLNSRIAKKRLWIRSLILPYLDRLLPYIDIR